MAGCIFTLGKIDKKLMIPLIYLVLYIFINIFEQEKYSNIAVIYIENFGKSLAEIMVFFISTFVKYAFKTKLEPKSEKQNYLKDFGILFIIIAFYKFNDILPYLFDKLNKDKSKYDNSREVLVNDALILIIITLATFVTLKYKYYIHHIICIVIMT